MLNSTNPKIRESTKNIKLKNWHTYYMVKCPHQRPPQNQNWNFANWVPVNLYPLYRAMYTHNGVSWGVTRSLWESPKEGTCVPLSQLKESHLASYHFRWQTSLSHTSACVWSLSVRVGFVREWRHFHDWIPKDHNNLLLFPFWLAHISDELFLRAHGLHSFCSGIQTTRVHMHPCALFKRPPPFFTFLRWSE